MNLNKLIKKENKEFWIFCAVLIGLTFLMVHCFMPLDKINPGHDDLFHYRRVYTLAESLNNGSFPIYMDNKAFENYGYGTKWFYPDLLLIPFASVANITTLGCAYKLMWTIATILCGLITYKMINKVYNNTNAASIGALLYTFSTYRLQDIYERAAMGEALSFTFIPIVFWGLYEIIKGNYGKWYIIAIGFTLLIYTHLLSSVLTLFTVLLFCCIYNKDFRRQPKRLLYLLLAGVVTVILCSYFILPFIEQMLSSDYKISNMNSNTGNESHLRTILKGLLYPHKMSIKEYFEPYIGLLLIICLLPRIFIKEKSNYIKSIDIGVIVGLIYIILTLDIFNWNKYPLKLINFIQFPWRLYEYSSFFFAIAGGYYISEIIKIKSKSKLIYSIITLLIGTLIVTNSLNYKKVTRYYYTKYEEPIMDKYNKSAQYATFEYLPQNMSINIIKQKGQNIDSKNKKAEISDIKRKNASMSCYIKTNENEQIEFPLTYYKGYTAMLNNEEVKVKESNNGLVEVDVKKSGNLTVEFSGTFLQKYSIYISLISFILLTIYIYIYNRKLKKRNA